MSAYADGMGYLKVYRVPRAVAAVAGTTQWTSSSIEKSGMQSRVVGFAADTRQQRRQRVDVRLRGAEVDDAGAKGEAAIDHRVGQKGLAAALDARQQLLIQLLGIRLGLGVPASGCRSPGRSGTS